MYTIKYIRQPKRNNNVPLERNTANSRTRAADRYYRDLSSGATAVSIVLLYKYRWTGLDVRHIVSDMMVQGPPRARISYSNNFWYKSDDKPSCSENAIQLTPVDRVRFDQYNITSSYSVPFIFDSRDKRDGNSKTSFTPLSAFK